MVIYHQKHVGGFAGAETQIVLGQTMVRQWVSITSAAAPVTLSAQWRATFRMVSARVFGRVN